MITNAQFDAVIAGIVDREGGFVDDPADRGGRTNFGITQATADAYALGDVANLTRLKAIWFYTHYLNMPRISSIPDLPAFELAADSAVNHGVGRAVEWLQEALGQPADGIIGPKTLAALNAVLPQNWPTIYADMLANRIAFYGHIVHNDPSQARFIDGWLSRATGFLSPWPY